MNNAKILIIDDDDSIRWVLEKAAKREQIAAVSVSNADNILEVIKTEQPDAIISDIRMPGTDGLEMLSTLQELHPELPVIIMTAHSDLDSAVSSYSRGAFEYLPKPFDIEEAVAVTQRALDHAREQDTSSVSKEAVQNQEIIGEAPAMQEVFRAIGRLSLSNISVLINGESGTGKELVAHALHHHSPRQDQPFIPLNVAAIPKELIESELFGHEKGAFTGAHKQTIGKVELAANGTLFLDEIGDMPMALQAKMLRFLQERVIERVGGREEIKVDVRVVCATNQNPADLIKANLFREDLYYRVSEITINIPPFRDREEGRLILARTLLQKYNKQQGRALNGFSEDAVQAIEVYSWPGNVRELENKIKGAVIMADGKFVTADDLGIAVGEVDAVSLNLREVRQQSESKAIRVALTKSFGNISKAAEMLGITRPTLYDLLSKYGMSAEGYSKRAAGS